MQRLGQLRAIGRPAAGFRALQWERGVANTSGLGGTTTPVPRLGLLAGAGHSWSSSTIQSRSGATFAPSLQLRFFATRPSSGPAGGGARRPPRAAGPSSRSSSGAGAAARGRPRTSYAPSSSSSTKTGDASSSASAAARQRPRPSPSSSSSSRASASAPPVAGVTPRKERQEKTPGQQRASAGEGISEHKGRTLGRAPEGQEKASEDRRKLQVLSPALHQAFDEMQFPNGFTDIQYYGIPEVLKRKDTILASQTGTGKTLAYLLPLVQLLHADEKAGMQTEPRRPACLILLPNRELLKQVLAVVKSLSAHVKLRSAGITSGVKLKIQKESLASPVDIIVSTPGRFLQHFEHERVFLSELRYLVVDEGDTLFDKTFKEDIEKMLMIVRKRVEKKGDRPPQTIVVTATVTSDLSDAINTHFPTATLVATSGLHRPLPRLKHEYVDITTNDKHEPLLKVLLGSKNGGRTIVFCNDMQSARSTHHFLTEQGFKASCMHSGILPKRRAEYFDQFSSGEFPILVCTDIASRGLDTTTVDHVVLFDFPENVTGYLHRVGRTARGGRRGRVTCLLKKGEKVFSEAIDLANTKQISLSEVLPYFNRTNPGKRERLAQWLDPLALLPDQKKRQQQQQQQQQHHQQQKQQKRR